MTSSTQKKGRLWPKVALGCLGVTILGAIGIGLVIASFFRESHYETHADIGGGIGASIPETARDVAIRTDLNGHFARYRIEPEAFAAFLDQLWRETGADSTTQRGEMSGDGSPSNQAQIKSRFGDFDWGALDGAKTYYGPTEENGAGSTFYYDASQGIAFQDTAYW